MGIKVKDKVKIAATRTGHNNPPDDARPYGKNLSMEAVRKYAEQNLERTLNAYRIAGEAGADVIVSVESALSFGDFGSLEKQKQIKGLIEEIPGPTSDKAAEISKKYKMYTATNYTERADDKLYNTTVFIGRDGKIIGKYRKVHLPSYESWYTSPGSEFPVFETDIGRIGFSTCYDITFPEHFRMMALNGADIVLHATGGWGFVTNYKIGQALLQVRAAENCVYLASAYTMNPNCPESNSCIISNKGEIMAANHSFSEDGIAMAEIDSDYEMINDISMSNFFVNVRSERMRVMLERTPAMYGPMTEENPPISKKFYPQYKLAKTPNELKDICRQYDQARQDEANGVHNDFWKMIW